MSKTILYLEDNANNAKMVEILLKREGFNVVIAKDSQEGHQLAMEYQPDLIICDYHLPGQVKGSDFIQMMRDEPCCVDIPILMLTADISTYPASMEAGADSYLNKPINREQLLDNLYPLLK